MQGWWKVERAQGRAPNLGMREHYMEVMQALDAFLQYSRQLYCQALSSGCHWLAVAVFGISGNELETKGG